MVQRSDLHEYRRKRDFRSTPEPAGQQALPGGQSDLPRFVIQKHHATTLHYDLRLEVGGTLKSWAVPKGPSTDPKDKRLAIHVEDHPLDYIDFEGTIPKGQYGGGAVIVWDTGTYYNLRADARGREISMSRALREGHAEFWLQGQKLQGAFALIHSKMRGDEKNWLLIKMKDAGADARRRPAVTQPESVLSGRTIEDVEAEGREPAR